jgi:hypothetical protein
MNRYLVVAINRHSKEVEDSTSRIFKTKQAATAYARQLNAEEGYYDGITDGAFADGETSWLVFKYKDK